MDGECSTHGGDYRKLYKTLFAKPERKRKLERPRRRWKDNITSRIGLREIGWEGVDWIRLTQDRDHWRAVVKTVMNRRIPYGGEFLD
jgi:hypothetical protein